MVCRGRSGRSRLARGVEVHLFDAAVTSLSLSLSVRAARRFRRAALLRDARLELPAQGGSRGEKPRCAGIRQRGRDQAWAPSRHPDFSQGLLDLGEQLLDVGIEPQQPGCQCSLLVDGGAERDEREIRRYPAASDTCCAERSKSQNGSVRVGMVATPPCSILFVLRVS